MHKLLLLIGFAGTLAACHKGSDPAPTPITATYGQQFNVRLQQAASLPQIAPAEVTLQIEDILDERLPSTVISPYATGKVTVLVRVTPARAPAQTVTLCQGVCTTATDSAAVTTLSGRYDIRFLNILPLDKYETVAKQDKVIELRVTRR